MGANPRLQERFLKAYESHGTISAAARESGVSRQSHYEWMANDEAYCDKFKGVRCVTCQRIDCLLYTSPSPRDRQKARMPSSA